MKKIYLFSALIILTTLILTSCTTNKEQKVTCTMCNGSGQVKYFYGEGDNDYNMGPCTSCDEKGYNIVIPSGNSGNGKNVVCGSCEKYVEKTITKEDAAGENRTWCSDCWESYDDIMGR